MPTQAAATQELEQRLRAQGVATQSGDAAAVVSASRGLLAVGLRQMGEIRAAQGEWEEAIKLDRGSLTLEDGVVTRLDLATALMGGVKTGGKGEDRVEQARRELDAVLAAEPHNARALRLREDVMLHPERLERAATLSPAQRKAMEAREGRLRAALAKGYSDWGTAEARQGKFEEAIGLFGQAEHWDPTTPGLMRNLGLAAFRAGHYTESARALDLALASERGSASSAEGQQLRVLLGLSLFSSQRFVEAVKAFEPLGDAVLDNSHAAYADAFSLAHTGDPGRANALLDKLSAKSLPADELALVCQVYDQTENYEHAVSCFRKVAAEDPAAKQAHYQMGIALIHLDRPSEAIPELRQELKLAGPTPEAQFYLAYALLQTSQKPEAEGLLKTVVAEQPENAQAQYQLGKMQLEQGLVKDAIAHLEVAAHALPGDYYVHYQLQSAYRRDGRTADADRELAIYREIKAKRREVGAAHETESP
jgi:tetratricopeptide (TPR) repeat protein